MPKKVRVKGKLRSWNEEKGFGFIAPNDGKKDVFIHISAFTSRDRRPEIGQIVNYELSTDDQGRPRAIEAALPGDQLFRLRKISRSAGSVIIAAIFFGLLIFSVHTHKIPQIILWIYLVISLITLLVYARDKSAAKEFRWRTSENTLHLLSLIGGWPGALIAQQALRHKSSKQMFRIAFWFTVIINCGALAWMYTYTGSVNIQSWITEGIKHINIGPKASIEWSE